MKKLLIVFLLAISAHTSFAQPALSTRIATFRNLVMSYYRDDTGFHRGFAMKYVSVLDSLRLYDSLMAVSVAGDLNTVLGVGNTSATPVIMTNGTYKTVLQYNSLSWFNGTTLLGEIDPNYGGKYTMFFKDPSTSYYGLIQSGTQTASHSVLIPNEGDGTGLDATLVTHTTKDEIIVDAGGSSTGTYGDGSAVIGNGAGDECSINNTNIYAKITGATTVDQLTLDPTSLAYAYTNSVGSVAHIAYLHFDRPSFTGTSTQNIWFTSHDGDTLATLGDLATATGTNISNTSLRWNGNYTQHVNKKAIILDSTLNFTITDTNHVTIFDAGSGVNTVKVLHLGSNSGTPSIAAGTGAGTSPSVSVTGSDLGGYVTITTGTSCSSSSIIATITFSKSFATAPNCVLTLPASSSAAALTPNAKVPFVNQADITTTTFDLLAGSTALSDGVTYKFYYQVIQ